ncbi:MAG: hypothetical protein UT55_C0032G0003 [Candidatus Peregrinibacteria bacterium GW2011_GWE2_39_6]|nr:MAG: hypothetical protein UT36_C0005G0060 [Candidatus Peregrinibacteria bacterium GW2011_GWF2_39_17]KKR25716.1 MAG: hypothetical protein UT55_C0032G0003 [Candidatus Peregrinibacteria bacterium GW2011_GWE2_39_6]HCW32895.1 hypothetical protein [Candidatus Peregrinibacteria bacterium]
MKKLGKLLSVGLVAAVFTTSVAFAATPETETQGYPHGPIYKTFNIMVQREIGMTLDEAISHVKVRDLKSTLEAQGVDVNALQNKYRNRLNTILNNRGMSLQIENVSEGVKISVIAENPTEAFLLRGSLLEARANYFNQTRATNVQFTLEGGNTENSLYMIVKGNTPEIAQAIQYRIPAYSAE